MPDSVGVKHVLIPASEKALADSLFQVVKSGKNTIEAVAAQYSSDPTCDLGRMAPDVFR
ncbi:MAG: peptidyl-prolyl cis-trans isomerase [Alistipes putredinis]|nr:MAG: peptidyl-prolyl cis-trans isomerase [Alistipes putredinis]